VSDCTCQLVGVDALIPLRHLVLRTGKPLSTCHWDGDTDSDTRHFAAVNEGAIVGIGSLYRRAHELVDDGHAWQLRGMATHPEQRGRGLGATLLDFMVTHCRLQDGGRVMWCNARTVAEPFYLRYGFRTLCPPFEIAGIGPHVVMRRDLADEARASDSR
jgi:predicted GNAT family N-acyltransferase